ncbi:MAG: pyruvate kinase [Planctomycetota bacterium]
MRLTKICATIGPATESEAALVALVLAGMDVARLNFSHGDLEAHARVVQRLRKAARKADRPIAILQDLQGPRIRVGKLAGGGLDLARGDRLLLSGRSSPVRGKEGPVPIPVTYRKLPQEVLPGQRILLKDGTIQLRALSSGPSGLLAEVLSGGRLTSGAGLNAPDSVLDVPALTRRDRNHLLAGAEMGIDAVALSFVRDRQDIVRARRILQGAGRKSQIVAKIERQEAIEHLEGILLEADGVIVARGDLGVECSLEAVPLLQKEIISRALASSCFSMTATQMLESMTVNPTPTRAEVSDVANAILEGSDAIMLSGETAVGAHPVKAVETMDRIARKIEAGARGSFHADALANSRPDEFLNALARSATELALYSGAVALVAFTHEGAVAGLLSHCRPGLPIFAFTGSEEVCRRLAMYRGVRARKIREGRTLEGLFDRGMKELQKEGLVRQGDVLVAVGGRWMRHGAANTLKVCRVSAP